MDPSFIKSRTGLAEWQGGKSEAKQRERQRETERQREQCCRVTELKVIGGKNSCVKGEWGHKSGMRKC